MADAAALRYAEKPSVMHLFMGNSEVTIDQKLSQEEWERKKFSLEMDFKERELQISKNRLKVEARRNILIGLLVPIIVALMTAVPAYINSVNQQALKQLEFEAQLITNSVKTGDPDQAAINLKFLIDSGLLGGKTAERVSKYLKNREPGVGRALPPG